MTSSALMYSCTSEFIALHFNHKVKTKGHALIGINVFALLKLTGHLKVAPSLLRGKVTSHRYQNDFLFLCFHKKGFALSLVLEVIVFLALENGLSDSSTFRKRL